MSMLVNRRILVLALIVVLAAGGYFLARNWPKSSAERSGGNQKSTQSVPRPVVTVEATYPGANAQVMADTVAAPIEQQLTGLDKMVQMHSWSTGDGTYTLDVLFESGVDPATAQARVQERVNRALAVLPDLVKRLGVTVRKKPANALMIVAVSSPEGTRDRVYLSEYAGTQLRKRLSRLTGVADVSALGRSFPNWRIWLDAEKMAARDLSPSDVAKTVAKAKKEGQLEDLVLKTNKGGGIIYLRDVARVERDPIQESFATLNRKPIVALVVYPTPEAQPRELSKAIKDEVARLGAELPQGVRVDIAFDFTPNLVAPDQSKTPEYLLLDLYLPDGASRERTISQLEACEATLRKGGVQDVLALTEHPFNLPRQRPCLLVRLAPAEGRQATRQQIMTGIRTRMNQEQLAVMVQLRDVTAPGRFPGWGHPIHLAILDRGDDGKEALQKVADDLTGQLHNKAPELTDLLATFRAAVPLVFVSIDPTALKNKNVSMDDLHSTLLLRLGSRYVQESNLDSRPGTWPVPSEHEWLRGRLEQMKGEFRQLKVRNNKGGLVPLADLVQLRDDGGPQVVERLDGYPMAAIIGEWRPGSSLTEARARCKRLLEQDKLPKGYRLTWVEGVFAAND
jgi:multidrug efflux pump subunit AcrB